MREREGGGRRERGHIKGSEREREGEREGRRKREGGEERDNYYSEKVQKCVTMTAYSCLYHDTEEMTFLICLRHFLEGKNNKEYYHTHAYNIAYTLSPICTHTPPHYIILHNTYYTLLHNDLLQYTVYGDISAESQNASQFLGVG